MGPYLILCRDVRFDSRAFASGFVNYKKGCIRLATASDKAYQLLAHGRWFSPGTPASSIIKTGRHDIAEILLKVALSTNNLTKIDSHVNTMFGSSVLPFGLSGVNVSIDVICIY